MIYILFVSLIAVCFIAYVASNRDVLSPWVIICAMFTLSTFFAMVNRERWGYQFHPFTVIVILSALFAFGIGALLSQYYLQKNSQENALQTKTSAVIIEISAMEMVFSIALLSLMFCFYFYKTYQLSLNNGNPGGIKDMVGYVRDAKLGFKRIGRPAEQCQVFAQCTSYIYLFIFLRNTIFGKFRLRWILYLIPTILQVMFEIIGGGRTAFIYITVFIIIVGCVCYLQKTNWDCTGVVKVICFGVIGLASFLVVFRFTGFLKGVGIGVSAFTSISKYIGFSIPGFDEYLFNGRLETKYIGDHTLFPIYAVLRVLGMKLPQLYVPYDFVSFPGIESNIYTALRRYIEDYTYIGMYLIMLLLGIMYSAFYCKIKYTKNKNFLLVLYATYCYPLFEISIEERFFMNIVGTTIVYQMIYLGIMYYIFVYRKEHPKEKKSSIKMRLPQNE